MKILGLMALLVALSSCGSETEKKNNAANATPNNANNINSANNTGAFAEVAFRVTNEGESSVFVEGRPFKIYHNDELVEVAWGGCGCGNKCEQNFGPSFGLRPTVTAAEVWDGSLLDTAECNLADDLVGETLEVEMCWATNVRSDDGALVDPTCERQEFVPGTTPAVVFAVAHNPEPRTTAFTLVLENASGTPIHIQTAKDCGSYPWWSIEVDGAAVGMFVPCGSCDCSEGAECIGGCTGECQQDATEELADGAERSVEITGLFVQAFEQTDSTCYQTQYLPAGPLTGRFCWGTEVVGVFVSNETCATFMFDMSESEGRFIVE